MVSCSYDDLLVKPEEDQPNLRPVPATRLAEELGTRMAANVVMLGYLVGATNVVSVDSVKKAIHSTLKPSIIDLNLKAFDTGLQLALENKAA